LAIVSVNELSGATGSENEKNEREYTRLFQVITNSRTDGVSTVRTATGIPRRGDVYATSTESDLSAVCKSVNPVQDRDNPRVWEVRVTYGPSDIEDDEVAENPLERPADISMSFAQFTRVCEKDINGKGIFNSAGYYFDPPPEIDDSRPVLVISRNEAAFNAALAMQYQDAVNSDSFFGASPGQAKIGTITSERVIENRFRYWRTTYEIHFRREGWKMAILDRGKRQKALNGEEGDVEYIQARNSSGQIMHGAYVTDAVPLDGQGRELRPATPTTAKYKEFDVYKLMPFSALGLP
jgi:hypothetical protein